MGWHIEPLDKSTNEALAREIGGDIGNTAPKVTCHDGVERGLWICSKELVSKFVASKTEYKFKVWVRRTNGVVYPFEFKPKRSAKITEMEKRLAQALKAREKQKH